MPSRRPILKRFAQWTVGAILVLAAYCLSAPFAFFWLEQHAPGAMPALQVVYAPLILYVRHPNWPGSEPFNRFQSWTSATIREYTVGPWRANDVLDGGTDIQFKGTLLRDVLDYLGEVHAFPVELDADVDGEVEITIAAKTSLRDALQEILAPHGLVAAPDEGRIVVGTPEAIDRIVAQRRAANPLVVYGPWVLIAIVVLILGAAAQLIRRRKSKHRATD